MSRLFSRYSIFLALMLAGTIQGAPTAEEAFGAEPCSQPTADKFSASVYIDHFAFEAALPFCDAGAKCSRSMRYWLAVREFSRGNYDAAEKWFDEAETFAAHEKLTKGWDKKKGWGRWEISGGI